ncbi:hypothetical protein ANN_14805 [Periplaneta americana]|uniref:Uncharacterized protein n=1 Tax=Periplaneta americana TaxID=6978 RepID=A0ABQ8SXA9_PERAM|nr:hypothetical protein ANN_14805 [Periplaneta americana]
MACLCEGGNEPPGSLKATFSEELSTVLSRRTIVTSQEEYEVSMFEHSAGVEALDVEEYDVVSSQEIFDARIWGVLSHHHDIHRAGWTLKPRPYRRSEVLFDRHDHDSWLTLKLSTEAPSVSGPDI